MTEANALLTEFYNKHGIQFYFPDFWELNEEKSENELTISINSPETSFWCIRLFDDPIEPEEIIETAVIAFQEEYEDVDCEDAEETICNRQAVGRDLGFSCQDLTNSVFLRSFRTGDCTILVYYQGTDHELKETLPILQGITSSLKCSGDELIF